MTRKCTCESCRSSRDPVTNPDPPRGPSAPSLPPPPRVGGVAQLRVEALNAAIAVHRLAADMHQTLSAPVRILAEDYYRWFSTGEW